MSKSKWKFTVKTKVKAKVKAAAEVKEAPSPEERGAKGGLMIRDLCNQGTDSINDMCVVNTDAVSYQYNTPEKCLEIAERKN